MRYKNLSKFTEVQLNENFPKIKMRHKIGKIEQYRFVSIHCDKENFPNDINLIRNKNGTPVIVPDTSKYNKNSLLLTFDTYHRIKNPIIKDTNGDIITMITSKYKNYYVSTIMVKLKDNEKIVFTNIINGISCVEKYKNKDGLLLMVTDGDSVTDLKGDLCYAKN